MQSDLINIKRIEPPFWWADMQLETLQILFYGEQMSKYTVRTDTLKINEVRVENSNYLFLEISNQDIKAGMVDFNFYLENKKVVTYFYEFRCRESNSSNRVGFDSSDSIYLIMPDRFASGSGQPTNHPEMTEKLDRANPEGRHGVDLQGIINNLDYIQNLGFTAIWSTPLLEDNEPVASYHTYAQTDYYRIDPRFGTNDLYRQSSDGLHCRGMKLIMDYVVNHWGKQHWMLQDLPEKRWAHFWNNQTDGFQKSNHTMSTQYDTYSSDIDKSIFVEGWFDKSMPDMSQTNPLFLQYIIVNAIWWVEFAALDGIRIDTLSYCQKEGVSKWIKSILEEYPNLNLVGEVWAHNQPHIAYWQKDSHIGAIQGFNSYCPSVMDFTLYDAICMMFNEDEVGDNNQGMYRAYENFSNDFLYANPMNIMVFAGNHDTTRINTLIHSDFNKYKLLLTLLVTVRGYPQFYYGDEIGLLGDKYDGDGQLRQEFPGGWSDHVQTAFTKEGRTKTQEIYHAFTKKLFNWRKNSKVIHEGSFKHFIPYNNLYVYFRTRHEACVMVVINNSLMKQSINWDVYKECISTFTKGYDVISRQVYSLNEMLEVNSKTSLILELEV